MTQLFTFKYNLSTKWALLFTLLLSFGFFSQHAGWNGNSRIDFIRAMVEFQTFAIDNFHDVLEWKTGDKALRQGHYYSDKAPGTALFGLIPYAIFSWSVDLFDLDFNAAAAKHWVTFFAVGIPVACSALYALKTLSIVGIQPHLSLLSLLFIFLGTLIFPFSTVFFGHSLSAAFVLIAFACVVRMRTSINHITNRSLWLLGTSAGLAILIEYTSAVLIAWCAVLYLVTLYEQADQGHRWSKLSLPILGALPPLLCILIYNYVCFGHPLSMGYHNLIDPQFKTGMSQGLFGVHVPKPKIITYLLFHPGHGLFAQSPVLLACVPGFFFMLRNKTWRLLGLCILGACVSLVLVNAGYFYWWGGASVGPRHLVPMLPLLLFPLALLPYRWFLAACVLGIFSMVQMAIVVMAQDGVVVPEWDLARIESLKWYKPLSIYDYAGRQLKHHRFTRNLGEEWLQLPDGWLSVLPWIICTTSIILLATQGLFKKSKPMVRLNPNIESEPQLPC